MAKVAVLVPFRELCEIARPLMDQYPHIQTMCVEYASTDTVADRARTLEQQGCELIISRGLHAQIIRPLIRIPVVELRMTAQELGTALLELKQEVGQERPRLAIVGFANMFCDTSCFENLFGIELRKYMVEHSNQLAPLTEQAARDGCVGVVGGEIACETARRIGLRHRFTSAGEESVRTALETASLICHAIDREKRNSAEMDAMLNYTFSGILQVDREGVVRRINRAGYDLLGKSPSELLGRPITRLLPNLNEHVLQDTLYQGKEAYAFLLDINHKAVIVNIAPVLVDGGIEGAVLTFQEGSRIAEMDTELRRELYQRGFIAKYNFQNLVCESPETRRTLELAKRIAKYPAPVLLTGESGTGKSILAQCIHNESLTRKNAFITLDCSAWMADTLDNMLFGNYSTRHDTGDSMVELAQNGTLYLNHVEALPAETQYKLLNAIQGRFMHNGSHRPTAINVRVIASSDVNLISRVEKGEFRSDLYYALSVLSVELLPLRRRREDILGWVNRRLEEWQEKYKRYVHLTQGARQFLSSYDWPGNLNQIDNVCERIVLLTEKRNIDEVFVRRQLEQVTPKLLPGSERVVLYKDQKAVEITELLRKYGGNREKVAAELGVSKTTLWRYIKKFGIGEDYSY